MPDFQKIIFIIRGGIHIIQAVFFDLYETLITEWEGDQKKATYSVAKLGLDEHVYKKEWAERIDRRMTGAFENHQCALEDILKSNNQTVDKRIIDEIHLQRVRAKTVPFLNIDNEIINTLHLLKNMNIKLGLISNCAPEEVEGWSQSPFAEIFDTTIFSYKVKYAKPNPKIYSIACEALKVAPQDSIFIGDGGSNELQGAADVGMNAYQATWFRQSNLHEDVFPKLNNPRDVIGIVKSKLEV